MVQFCINVTKRKITLCIKRARLCDGFWEVDCFLFEIKKSELGNRDMAEVHTKTKQAMMALQGMADVKIHY